MAYAPAAIQSFLQLNLKRSLFRLLTVGQVFGLVAWDLEPLEPDRPTTKLHWFRKLIRTTNQGYCLMIIVAIGTATVLHHSSNTADAFFAIRTLYLTENVIVNVIVLLAMLECQQSRPFYASILKELFELDKNLHDCDASINFLHVEAITDRLLVCAVLYFSTSSLVDWWADYDPSCTFLCHSVLYILPNVINVLALYQYAALQLIVAACYRSVNSVLARYHDHQARPKVRDCAELVETLRRTHLKLGDLTGRVVGRFGPLIVCTVLSSFVVLNLELINVYKATGRGCKRVWSASEGFRLVRSLLWIGLHGAKILLILYPGHRARVECERTGPTLYEIANRYEAAGRSNSALMKFAGQLLLLHGKRHHCKACGLITLDLTLISKIVAGLTTYLMILIQFDSAFTQGSR